MGHSLSASHSRDRIVVSTSRCGRDNPGSNPGHGIAAVQCRCYGIVDEFFSKGDLYYSVYYVVNCLFLYVFFAISILYCRSPSSSLQKHVHEIQSRFVLFIYLWDLHAMKHVVTFTINNVARRQKCIAQRGARTHDPEIKSLMLYRLS